MVQTRYGVEHFLDNFDENVKVNVLSRVGICLPPFIA